MSELKKWADRNDWIEPTILPSMKAMQSRGRTLGPVSVAKVKDLIAKKCSSEWSPEQKQKLSQELLFEPRKPLERIPFEFRFVWCDQDGDEHRSLFIAWELGQAWRAYRKRYDDPVDEMRTKWLTDLCAPNRRLAFYVGNIVKRPKIFMVCGIFNPPEQEIRSGSLFAASE